MSLNVAKCNFSKVKLRANVVCVLPLKRMRSMGWTQGPLLTLWLAMPFMLAFWADLCGSGVKANLCRFWLSLSPSLPFWGCVIPLVWQCQLVVACTGGSRSQGCHGYLLAMPEKAPVPKLIYWRWVQCLLLTMGPPLYLVRSEPHEGLAVCRAKAVPSILSYLKALSIGLACGNPPPPALQSSALPTKLTLPHTM